MNICMEVIGKRNQMYSMRFWKARPRATGETNNFALILGISTQ